MNPTGKIGILTFHCTNNYGAVLQAYALKTILQNQYKNKEVQIIDYRCNGTITNTDFITISQKKGFLNTILHYFQIKSLAKKFDRFRNHRLSLSKPYYNKDQLSLDVKNYDALISGSDQVWNRKWSENDDVYFQDFHNENDKKYSYAVSLGFEKIDSNQCELYKNYLQKFRKLSTREKSAAQTIIEQLGLYAETHIDPTLLLSASEWNKIAISPKFRKKYILVYMVPYQTSIISYAKLLKRRTGMPIVTITKAIKPLTTFHPYNCSPEEFIGWFKDAEYIVTNSFHGTAFSIIYKKKFFIDMYTSRGFNVRSDNLLNICGINNNYTKGKIISLTDINWDTVEKNIQAETKKSLEYLSKICCN